MNQNKNLNSNNLILEGDNGTKQSFDLENTNNMNQQSQSLKPKNNNIIKMLVIMFGCFIGIVILIIGIIFVVSSNSKKLVCKSNEGDITIMYNDDSIFGYTANGISYDLDGQKEYAKIIGVEAYLEEFSVWFKNNTTGSCNIKNK